MKKIIIVCGPTATGKTALALQLAKELGGELVSADSRQIYQGMDIGTGKDLEYKKTIETLKLDIEYDKKIYNLTPYDIDGVPLWMYDVVRPDEPFSVAHYQYLANRVIDSIADRKKVPIVVGGTGLYIRSILTPFETAQIKPDTVLRKKLAGVDLSILKDLVKSENQDVWNNLNESDRSNPRRLIRKLEIARSPKHPSSSDTKRKEYIAIGLTASNSKLNKYIDARVEKRMKQGLLEEIQTLISNGYDWRLQSFDALGYRQWRQWFENPRQQSEVDKDKIMEKWKHDEHAYARRQMTWFKKDKNIRWFDISKRNGVHQAKTAALAWYNISR